MISSKMTNEQFREWRKRLGWKREEAALKLGVSLPTVGNYERGRRPDGKESPIPLVVSLACHALKAGLQPLGEPQ